MLLVQRIDIKNVSDLNLLDLNSAEANSVKGIKFLKNANLPSIKFFLLLADQQNCAHHCLLYMFQSVTFK